MFFCWLWDCFLLVVRQLSRLLPSTFGFVVVWFLIGLKSNFGFWGEVDFNFVIEFFLGANHFRFWWWAFFWLGWKVILHFVVKPFSIFLRKVDWNLPRLWAIRTKWSLQRRICPWGQGRFPAPQQGSPWKEGGWRWGKIGKNRRWSFDGRCQGKALA